MGFSLTADIAAPAQSGRFNNGNVAPYFQFKYARITKKIEKVHQKDSNIDVFCSPSHFGEFPGRVMIKTWKIGLRSFPAYPYNFREPFGRSPGYTTDGAGRSRRT
jgi:hypothetical protein